MKLRPTNGRYCDVAGSGFSLKQVWPQSVFLVSRLDQQLFQRFADKGETLSGSSRYAASSRPSDRATSSEAVTEGAGSPPAVRCSRRTPWYIRGAHRLPAAQGWSGRDIRPP